MDNPFPLYIIQGKPKERPEGTSNEHIEIDTAGSPENALYKKLDAQSTGHWYDVRVLKEVTLEVTES